MGAGGTSPRSRFGEQLKYSSTIPSCRRRSLNASQDSTTSFVSGTNRRLRLADNNGALIWADLSTLRGMMAESDTVQSDDRQHFVRGDVDAQASRLRLLAAASPLRSATLHRIGRIFYHLPVLAVTQPRSGEWRQVNFAESARTPGGIVHCSGNEDLKRIPDGGLKPLHNLRRRDFRSHAFSLAGQNTSGTIRHIGTQFGWPNEHEMTPRVLQRSHSRQTLNGALAGHIVRPVLGRRFHRGRGNHNACSVVLRHGPAEYRHGNAYQRERIPDVGVDSSHH